MTHKARDEALSAFRDDDEENKSGIQVLIASLKCGGTGESHGLPLLKPSLTLLALRIELDRSFQSNLC